MACLRLFDTFGPSQLNPKSFELPQITCPIRDRFAARTPARILNIIFKPSEFASAKFWQLIVFIVRMISEKHYF